MKISDNEGSYMVRLPSFSAYVTERRVFFAYVGSC